MGPEEITRTVLYGGASIIALNTAARAFWVVVGRKVGFYSPDNEAFFIRLPWRRVWRFVSWLREWRETVFDFGKKATGGWTGTLSSMCLRYRPGHVYLGRPRMWWGGGGFGGALGAPAKRHLVMIAGTRSGKTILLSTKIGLLHRKASALIVDPKSQLFTVNAAALRLAGRLVYLLAPTGAVRGERSHGWNPLEEIRRLGERLGREVITWFCDKLAFALIEKEYGSNKHFPDSARELLAALIAFVLMTEPPHKRNLARVRELLLHGYREYTDDPVEAMGLLAIAMRNNKSFGPYIPKGAAVLLSGGVNSKADVLSTIRTATAWLDHPTVVEMSSRHDFSLSDLKGGNCVVFMCAETTEIRGALAPFFRMAIEMLFYGFEKIPGGLKHPTLAAIDELPSLGFVESIEAAAPVLASSGIRFLGIAQDIELLARAYPKSWEGFIGNSDFAYFLGLNHAGTAEYLSRRVLGTVTRIEDVDGRKFAHERPLLTEQQCKSFLDPDKGNMIVARYGKKPIRARLGPYYKELPIWKYSPDPDYGDDILRGAFRRVLAPLQTLLREHSIRLSENEARALFGLPDTFSRHELRTRAALLEARFPPALVAAGRRQLERFAA